MTYTKDPEEPPLKESRPKRKKIFIAGLFLFVTVTWFVFTNMSIDADKPSDIKIVLTPTETTAITLPINKKQIIIVPQNALPDPAFAKFQSGDYETTIKLIRAKLSKTPLDSLLKQNLGVALYAFALVKVREQKFDEAIKFLEESSSLNNNEALYTLAQLRIKIGDYNLGTNLLDEYFEKTQNLEALITLIDLSSSKDDIPKSQYYLSKAENLSLQNKNLQDKLGKYITNRKNRISLKESMQNKNLSLDKGIIQVTFPKQNMANFAENIANSLDADLQEISENFIMPPVNFRIKVALLASQNFAESTGAPPWAQAIYDGIIRIPVVETQLDTTSFRKTAILAKHEMFHAYLQELCGWTIPSWLNEGLAMVFEKRNINQSKLALKMRYGSVAKPEFASDPFLNNSFIDAPKNLVEELYARSHILVANLSAIHGNSIWKTILTRHCVQKDSLPTVLQEEIDGFSAVDLWEKTSN